MTNPVHFVVISGSALKSIDGYLFGYAPYIKELNLWFKHVEKVTIVAPVKRGEITPIDLRIEHPDISFKSVPEFSLIGTKNVASTILYMPWIFTRVIFAMSRGNHIHLRCPSNLGLIGSVCQALFWTKKKTAKYAANWDPESQQPWSYKLQQHILKNTAITKNMQVLVYGNWPDKSKNIKPFFTATYKEADIEWISARNLARTSQVNLIFVGSLSENKKPILALNVLDKLRKKGVNAHLKLYGEGAERPSLEQFIEANALSKFATLMGSRTSEEVKDGFKEAHFLVFISRSEGWPKVVAESMFWGCFPITTEVSMVPEMLDFGKRGALVHEDENEVVEVIEGMIANLSLYELKCNRAIEWSRQFTLEKLEAEIEKLV